MAVPNSVDAQQAKELRRQLGARPRCGKLRVYLDESGDRLEVPPIAVELLLAVLEQLGEGQGVAVLPLNRELTTQEAADILNVSRPFLVRLLDEGKIGHRLVGTHRRVLLRDLLDYKRSMDRAARAALDELAQQAQELDMGY